MSTLRVNPGTAVFMPGVFNPLRFLHKLPEALQL
jgi:hypothetical protein